MKLTIVLLTAAFIQVSASSGYAQKITLSEKNIGLEKVFREIRKQAGYDFFYNSRLLKSAKPVDIDVKEASLEETLKQCFAGQPFTYTVALNAVVVQRKPERAGPVTVQHTVSGVVSDTAGMPLPGVTVMVKDKQVGTTTDAEGRYTLENIAPDAILVVNFLGYEPREIPVDERGNINITMRVENSLLDEVVVVGYGTQKRQQITSAIASVSSEDFVKGSVTDAGQLIRGKVAGLNIVTPDGNPTATSQVNLRGVATVNASTAPLVLIDGVPGTLTTVAPEDIQSIDVLKDGSAAAIYGTRGTNGVILITTKKVDRETPASIDINTYFTSQAITRKLDFMGAAQYRQLVEEGRPGATDYGYETNWLDEILQTPLSAVYNISLRGGGKNTSYIANINYRRLNGIIKRSDNDIIYPRLEIDHRMFDDKLKINLNVSGFQQKYFTGSDGSSYRGDVYRNGLTFNPTDRPGDDEGNWIERTEKTDYMNPVALLEETQGENQNSNLRTFGTITWFPRNDIEVKLLGSREINNATRGYYETKNHISTVRDGRNGYASRGTSRSQDDLLELTAQYNKSLNEHEITALGGYSWRTYQFEDYWMQNWDFPTDEFSYNNMMAGLALRRGEAPESSLKTENRLVSYFLRLNYSFQDKYLLMASLRHEGSSKFGANHKWGDFPAVSAGWNIQKEPFLQDLTALSALKIRAGFGITGTEPVDPYMSLDRVNFDTYSLFDGQWRQVVNPASNANPDLRWEKKEELNIGIDYGFLNDRITGSVDWYRRTTRDLLFDYPVPTPPYLYPTVWANAASMENRGIEVQINASPVEKPDFQWNTSVNYSSNKNKILSLSDDQFQLVSGYMNAGNTGEPIQQITHRIQVGQPMGNFFGFNSLDIDENGYWIIEGKDGQSKPIAQQQADDRQVIGNGLPKYYLSWNNTIAYKNFDLNITMRGAFGFQILNMPEMFYSVPVMLTRGNLLASAYDNIYGKRPLADDQSLQYVSYYIEDGDYWKIDNVTLGYNLSLQNKYLKRIRLYASASNLITITKYEGIDPEVGISGLAPGVDDKNRYPATTSFTLGAFLTF